MKEDGRGKGKGKGENLQRGKKDWGGRKWYHYSFSDQSKVTLQHRLACAKTNALPQLAVPALAPPEPKCKPPFSVLPTNEQILRWNLCQ